MRIAAKVAATLAALVAGLVAGPAQAQTGPCDIYASGGTPCIAAHSTVRALYGAYSGSLYRVRRSSDNTTKDIPVLSAGGYADASVQDSFCAGTTCVVTILFDQSGKGNHLEYQGSGSSVGGQDDPAVANRESLSVGGHKVYSLYINPGNSYWRNGSSTGVPKGTSPEGMYMVTSGTHVNSGCCFDYGNSETDRKADGAGAMDAIYFGTSCWFGGCSGSGPWVQADLEYGLYPGGSQSWNPNQRAFTNAYVTAMLKNNGTSNMALKGANAQSGGLTTLYSGSLPPGYNPMKKQGAIILGSGGDCCATNRNQSQGTFYEGVMVSGFPSDATEAAVQANIVAAGYGQAGTSYTLGVTKAGTGSGTVTSNTGGVNCGSTCSANLASGTTVTLTAAAASGSTFGGWSGSCTGTGTTCTVSMTAARSVTATFNGTPTVGPTSVNVGGAAAGTFAADVNFSGGSTYSTTNAIDTTQITGTVPPQAVLQTERYGEFTYTVPGLPAGNAYAVTLYFSESYWTAAGQRTFNVAINGVTVLTAFDIYAAAGGVNKAIARTYTTTANASGQVVIALTKGGGPDNPKLCGFAVTGGVIDPGYSLTVTKGGTGTGTVAGGSISCGSACSASGLASGTVVTLTATPSTNSTFTGWGGDCSGTGACVVTMSAARNVTATFDATNVPPTYTLTVTKAGTGTGTVVGGPLSCGSACTASGLSSGTVITLTASPATGSTFGGWGGACSGTAATCTVTVTSSTTVTASFAASGTTCKAITGGQSGNFNTTAAICFTITGTVNGWGCSNADGRTVSVNGTATTCGKMPLPGSSPYTFSFTAGSYAWASMYWW